MDELIDYSFSIFRHTPIFQLFGGAQFLLVEEGTQLVTVYLGRHRRPSASNLIYFVTHSDRSEQDLNPRWLNARDLVVWDWCPNHSATEEREMGLVRHFVFKLMLYGVSI
jgi:hypothetical protein